MTNNDKLDRIEQLEWNIKHCEGWFYFGKQREWKAELDRLRSEVVNED